MIRSRLLVAALVLATSPAYGMQILTPPRVEFGGVIPVTVKLDSPLRAGQSLEVQVNHQLAARLNLVSGSATEFSTRVVSTRKTAEVEARVLSGNSVLQRATRSLSVKVPGQAGKPTSTVSRIRAKSRGGILKVLVSTPGAFSGTLVLKGQGSRADIVAGPMLPRNPYFSITGSLSGNVTVSANGSVTQLARQTTPVSRPAPAPVQQRVSPTRDQLAQQAAQEKKQRIYAAQQACESEKNSCETKCATKALINVLAQSKDATAHLRCTNVCDESYRRCEQGVEDMKYGRSPERLARRQREERERQRKSNEITEGLNQISDSLNKMAQHQQALDAERQRQAAAREQERQRRAQEAEQERMAAIQARNDQERIRQQQLARERARSSNTVGNGAPIRGTVINPRPNDSYQPKPRKPNSRVIATTGVPATPCVKVLTGPNGRGRTFQNTCGFPIEIAWCYVNADCTKGSWGYSNTWTIGAGRTYPATSFESKLYRFTLHYAACKGANVFVKETGPNTFYCKG